MLSWPLFASTFGVVFVAELPDKTAFATLILATRKHPVAVFLGAAAAFFIQSMVAVGAGSALSLLPARFIKVGAGILFLGFAVAMWLRKEPTKEESPIADDGRATFIKTAGTAFVVIFLAEWGDLTQLATATIAARHKHPLTIFLAATLALWTVTVLAVAIGNRMKAILDPQILQRAAAVAFAVVGIVFLV
jgi:putative Ca2+/H+ antiporter (TMEM165/GDT1 family)